MFIEQVGPSLTNDEIALFPVFAFICLVGINASMVLMTYIYVWYDRWRAK